MKRVDGFKEAVIVRENMREKEVFGEVKGPYVYITGHKPAVFMTLREFLLSLSQNSFRFQFFDLPQNVDIFTIFLWFA